MQLQSDKLELGNSEKWRRSWRTGLVMQVPLFDGNRSRARVAATKHEVARIAAEKERLWRSVARDIKTAYLHMNETDERMLARRGTIEQARQGLHVAESRYAGGVGTQLEILDAQLALADAEVAVATAKRDRARAVVELEKATGVLGEDVGKY